MFPPDFIRTYTWDKKLENWVKESAFLGGNGKEPTIVSPEQYKNRFRDAMEGYFLMVSPQHLTRTALTSVLIFMDVSEGPRRLD